MDGKQARGDSRLLVVTDLGIAARVFRGGALVWVNSLRTAEPAAGAAVTVFARNNQVLARGTTDERGLAQLEWPADEEIGAVPDHGGTGGRPVLRGSEPARAWSRAKGSAGARYPGAGEVEAAVFSDRGVYRPGETVFMQALVRDGQMRAPEPFPALLRVRRPDGRIFQDIPGRTG